jgi:hypothetical protein
MKKKTKKKKQSGGSSIIDPSNMGFHFGSLFLLPLSILSLYYLMGDSGKGEVKGRLMDRRDGTHVYSEIKGYDPSVEESLRRGMKGSIMDRSSRAARAARSARESRTSRKSRMSRADILDKLRRERTSKTDKDHISELCKRIIKYGYIIYDNKNHKYSLLVIDHETINKLKEINNLLTKFNSPDTTEKDLISAVHSNSGNIMNLHEQTHPIIKAITVKYNELFAALLDKIQENDIFNITYDGMNLLQYATVHGRGHLLLDKFIDKDILENKTEKKAFPVIFNNVYNLKINGIEKGVIKRKNHIYFISNLNNNGRIFYVSFQNRYCIQGRFYLSDDNYDLYDKVDMLYFMDKTFKSFTISEDGNYIAILNQVDIVRIFRIQHKNGEFILTPEISANRLILNVFGQFSYKYPWEFVPIEYKEVDPDKFSNQKDIKNESLINYLTVKYIYWEDEKLILKNKYNIIMAKISHSETSIINNDRVFPKIETLFTENERITNDEISDLNSGNWKCEIEELFTFIYELEGINDKVNRNLFGKMTGFFEPKPFYIMLMNIIIHIYKPYIINDLKGNISKKLNINTKFISKGMTIVSDIAEKKQYHEFKVDKDSQGKDILKHNDDFDHICYFFTKLINEGIFEYDSNNDIYKQTIIKVVDLFIEKILEEFKKDSQELYFTSEINHKMYKKTKNTSPHIEKYDDVIYKLENGVLLIDNKEFKSKYGYIEDFSYCEGKKQLVTIEYPFKGHDSDYFIYKIIPEIIHETDVIPKPINFTIVCLGGNYEKFADKKKINYESDKVLSEYKNLVEFYNNAVLDMKTEMKFVNEKNNRINQIIIQNYCEHEIKNIKYDGSGDYRAEATLRIQTLFRGKTARRLAAAAGIEKTLNSNNWKKTDPDTESAEDKRLVTSLDGVQPFYINRQLFDKNDNKFESLSFQGNDDENFTYKFKFPEEIQTAKYYIIYIFNEDELNSSNNGDSDLIYNDNMPLICKDGKLVDDLTSSHLVMYKEIKPADGQDLSGGADSGAGVGAPPGQPPPPPGGPQGGPPPPPPGGVPPPPAMPATLIQAIQQDPAARRLAAAVRRRRAVHQEAEEARAAARTARAVKAQNIKSKGLTMESHDYKHELYWDFTKFMENFDDDEKIKILSISVNPDGKYVAILFNYPGIIIYDVDNDCISNWLNSGKLNIGNKNLEILWESKDILLLYSQNDIHFWKIHDIKSTTEFSDCDISHITAINGDLSFAKQLYTKHPRLKETKFGKNDETDIQLAIRYKKNDFVMGIYNGTEISEEKTLKLIFTAIEYGNDEIVDHLLNISGFNVNKLYTKKFSEFIHTYDYLCKNECQMKKLFDVEIKLSALYYALLMFRLHEETPGRIKIIEIILKKGSNILTTNISLSKLNKTLLDEWYRIIYSRIIISGIDDYTIIEHKEWKILFKIIQIILLESILHSAILLENEIIFKMIYEKVSPIQIQEFNTKKDFLELKNDKLFPFMFNSEISVFDFLIMNKPNTEILEKLYQLIKPNYVELDQQARVEYQAMQIDELQGMASDLGASRSKIAAFGDNKRNLITFIQRIEASSSELEEGNTVSPFILLLRNYDEKTEIIIERLLKDDSFDTTQLIRDHLRNMKKESERIKPLIGDDVSDDKKISQLINIFKGRNRDAAADEHDEEEEEEDDDDHEMGGGSVGEASAPGGAEEAGGDAVARETNHSIVLEVLMFNSKQKLHIMKHNNIKFDEIDDLISELKTNEGIFEELYSGYDKLKRISINRVADQLKHIYDGNKEEGDFFPWEGKWESQKRKTGVRDMEPSKFFYDEYLKLDGTKLKEIYDKMDLKGLGEVAIEQDLITKKEMDKEMEIIVRGDEDGIKRLLEFMLGSDDENNHIDELLELIKNIDHLTENFKTIIENCSTSLEFLKKIKDQNEYKQTFIVLSDELYKRFKKLQTELDEISTEFKKEKKYNYKTSSDLSEMRRISISLESLIEKFLTLKSTKDEIEEKFKSRFSSITSINDEFNEFEEKLRKKSLEITKFKKGLDKRKKAVEQEVLDEEEEARTHRSEQRRLEILEKKSQIELAIKNLERLKESEGLDEKKRLMLEGFQGRIEEILRQLTEQKEDVRETIKKVYYDLGLTIQKLRGMLEQPSRSTTAPYQPTVLDMEGISTSKNQETLIHMVNGLQGVVERLLASSPGLPPAGGDMGSPPPPREGETDGGDGIREYALSVIENERLRGLLVQREQENQQLQQQLAPQRSQPPAATRSTAATRAAVERGMELHEGLGGTTHVRELSGSAAGKKGPPGKKPPGKKGPPMPGKKGPPKKKANGPPPMKKSGPPPMKKATAPPQTTKTQIEMEQTIKSAGELAIRAGIAEENLDDEDDKFPYKALEITEGNNPGSKALQYILEAVEREKGNPTLKPINELTPATNRPMGHFEWVRYLKGKIGRKTAGPKIDYRGTFQTHTKPGSGGGGFTNTSKTEVYKKLIEIINIYDHENLKKLTNVKKLLNNLSIEYLSEIDKDKKMLRIDNIINLYLNKILFNIPELKNGDEIYYYKDKQWKPGKIDNIFDNKCDLVLDDSIKIEQRISISQLKIKTRNEYYIKHLAKKTAKKAAKKTIKTNTANTARAVLLKMPEWMRKGAKNYPIFTTGATAAATAGVFSAGPFAATALAAPTIGLMALKKFFPDKYDQKEEIIRRKYKDIHDFYYEKHMYKLYNDSKGEERNKLHWKEIVKRWGTNNQTEMKKWFSLCEKTKLIEQEDRITRQVYYAIIDILSNIYSDRKETVLKVITGFSQKKANYLFDNNEHLVDKFKDVTEPSDIHFLQDLFMFSFLFLEVEETLQRDFEFTDKYGNRYDEVFSRNPRQVKFTLTFKKGIVELSGKERTYDCKFFYRFKDYEEHPRFKQMELWRNDETCSYFLDTPHATAEKDEALKFAEEPVAVGSGGAGLGGGAGFIRRNQISPPSSSGEDEGEDEEEDKEEVEESKSYNYYEEIINDLYEKKMIINYYYNYYYDEEIYNGNFPLGNIWVEIDKPNVLNHVITFEKGIKYIDDLGRKNKKLIKMCGKDKDLELSELKDESQDELQDNISENTLPDKPMKRERRTRKKLTTVNPSESRSNPKKISLKNLIDKYQNKGITFDQLLQHEQKRFKARTPGLNDAALAALWFKESNPGFDSDISISSLKRTTNYYKTTDDKIIIDVPGDGSCFYHAVNVFMGLSEKPEEFPYSYSELRKKLDDNQSMGSTGYFTVGKSREYRDEVIRIINGDKVKYEDLFNNAVRQQTAEGSGQDEGGYKKYGTFENWLKKLKDSKTYSDQIEIGILSEHLRKKIVTYRLKDRKCLLTKSPCELFGKSYVPVTVDSTGWGEISLLYKENENGNNHYLTIINPGTTAAWSNVMESLKG